MANTDIRVTTTSDLTNAYADYSVDSASLDSPADQDETTYINSDAEQQYGYYKTIPELHQAINSLASWTCGKGWTSDIATSVVLDKINGWGEDTFQSICENLVCCKKIYGDAFAEVVRSEKGTLINLKPLNTACMQIVVNRAGVIIRYEQINKTKKFLRKFKPTEIFHISNDRIADQIHGTSVITACEKVILARNEAITDWQKVLHRNINPLKIIEVDSDNEADINKVKTQYQNMTKDYECLFVPKGNMTITIPPVPLQDPTTWISYLDNFFYQAVGVPKIIVGGTNDTTEASAKIGFLVFEQPYMREQRLLEGDLWQQLGIKVAFERPVSLKEDLASSEAANTGQVGMQPSEIKPQIRRNE